MISEDIKTHPNKEMEIAENSSKDDAVVIEFIEPRDCYGVEEQIDKTQNEVESHRSDRETE